MTISSKQAGTVLAERRKGAVIWQARISSDRGRLEVIGLVEPSATVTAIEHLSEPELRELLDGSIEDHHAQTVGRIDAQP